MENKKIQGILTRRISNRRLELSGVANEGEEDQYPND